MLSPAFRDILYAWPADEVRRHERRRLRWNNGTDQEKPVSETQVKIAVARNLLTETVLHKQWPVIRELYRTSVPVKRYKPRGANPNYDGPFPWGVDEHWRQIQQSPFRQSRAIAERLTDPRERDLELEMRFPKFVHTEAELTTFRHTLLRFFGGKPRKGRRRYSNWVAAPLRHLLATGENLYALLMDMRVRPVFNGQKFERFVAVDPAEASRELERITGETGNVVEKYQKYLKAHGKEGT